MPSVAILLGAKICQNRKLADWLIDDNTVLPHHSLGLQSPATSSSNINHSVKGDGLIHAMFGLRHIGDC